MRSFPAQSPPPPSKHQVDLESLSINLGYTHIVNNGFFRYLGSLPSASLRTDVHLIPYPFDRSPCAVADRSTEANSRLSAPRLFTSSASVATTPQTQPSRWLSSRLLPSSSCLSVTVVPERCVGSYDATFLSRCYQRPSSFTPSSRFSRDMKRSPSRINID